MADLIDDCLVLAAETCQILAASPLAVPAQSVVGSTAKHLSTVGLMVPTLPPSAESLRIKMGSERRVCDRVVGAGATRTRP